MDRWIISINYVNGEDYLNKLANLQAVVAFPEGAGQFRVFMDLTNRPFQGQPQTAAELSKLNRIYWAQSDSAVLKDLAKSLGVASPPSLAYVFFPRALEEELLAKELAYAGLTEDQLNERKIETKFRAQRQSDKWLVTVLEQKPRK
jgi:hypothetical protein